MYSEGRKRAELKAPSLAKACEALGAGEILLNCIDKDGTNSGLIGTYQPDQEQCPYPAYLLNKWRRAGRALKRGNCAEAKADAVLAAGTFHRHEAPIEGVRK